MTETHVHGRAQYIPGAWGAAVPCAGVRIEILDQDVGNPDDVLWTGTTAADGGFTADSDARWRDQLTVKYKVLVTHPFPQLPTWEDRERQVDDPLDVKLIMARVTEGSHQITFAPVVMTPGGELVAPLLVPWAPPVPVLPPPPRTHVRGRVQYPPGIWGVGRPCVGARVEVIDQDVGNPDDVLWTGTTDGDGWFTADSDVAWRDRIRIGPWTVDDPSDVKLLMVRVTDAGRQQIYAPLAMTPGGALLVPLIVSWAFPGAIVLPVSGTVYRAVPPRAPAQLVRVRIEDRDPGDGSVDVVFDGITDLDGRFGGFTRDARSWLEGLGDAPLLSATVTEGTAQLTFPIPFPIAPPFPDRIVVPPIVLPGGQLPATTPCGALPGLAIARTAEVEARRPLERWGYRGGIAGCSDPIPPWTVPTATHSGGFGATVVASASHAAEVRLRWTGEPFDQLDDFRRFFPPFQRPRVLDRYPNAGDVIVPDQEFADQRLAGPNPVMLRRVNAAAEIASAFGGGFAALATRCAAIADLQQLMTSRRLYVIDYEILGDAPPTTGGKYMPCPFALFGVLGGRLAPLAIQIERRFDAQNNPVFTPDVADRTMWNIAKLMVQIADMNVHELQSHLHDTHLAMEPFAVAMERTMSSTHPISRLLQRHFMGMIAKNAQARDYLTAPWIGPVQRILGVTYDGANAVVARASARWSFPAHALPTFLRDRGLDDAQALPDYPYRDDGLVIWNAIAAFVTDYVAHTYASDAEITGCDTEVQRWLAEVRAFDGGRRPSVPAVQGRADLAAVVTQIIFTCSAQHSAVNTPQWDFMAFVPNMPGSAYARPLPSAQGPGELRLARILPGADAALDQTALMWQLAGYRYDQLGRYDGVFEEPWATDVRRFQDRLAVIEGQLAATDAARRIKYDYLRPSRIVNSINV